MKKPFAWFVFGLLAFAVVGAVSHQLRTVDLADFSTTAPSNGQVAKYVSATGLWTPGTDNEAGTGVYRTLYIDAGAMVACSTNGAATGTYTPTGSDNMTVDVYDFDSSTSEGVQFKVAMPDEWNGGTVKVKFFWTAASGSGGVVWALKGGAFSDDDAFGAGLGTAQQVADTLLATGDNHVTSATPAITIGGTPALGDIILFDIHRLPADGSDTLAADARLLGVSIQYLESTTEPSAW